MATAARSIKVNLFRFNLLNSYLFISSLIVSTSAIVTDDSIDDSMVFILGGLTDIGLDKPILPQDGEGPMRQITVPSFYIDKTEVTNEQFKLFVDNTGYVTEVNNGVLKIKLLNYHQLTEKT